jgi:hypothetical protein
VTDTLSAFNMEMSRYFSAEKTESLLFLAAGMVAILASWWLWRAGGTWRGMVYPLAAIAAIQIAVGGSVYLRTDAQVASFKQQLHENPKLLQVTERERMAKVMTNFIWYKALEIALLLAGIAFTFFTDRLSLLNAVGIGLIVQSALMLVLDLFAERRGEQYLNAVNTLL